MFFTDTTSPTKLKKSSINAMYEGVTGGTPSAVPSSAPAVPTPFVRERDYFAPASSQFPAPSVQQTPVIQKAPPIKPMQSQSMQQQQMQYMPMWRGVNMQRASNLMTGGMSNGFNYGNLQQQQFAQPPVPYFNYRF
jgi:hypothetical protein